LRLRNTKHTQSLDEIEALKALIATTASERDQAVAAFAAGREALASSRASLTEAERSTGLLVIRDFISSTVLLFPAVPLAA
jgi:hypothetical protein